MQSRCYRLRAAIQFNFLRRRKLFLFVSFLITYLIYQFYSLFFNRAHSAPVQTLRSDQHQQVQPSPLLLRSSSLLRHLGTSSARRVTMAHFWIEGTVKNFLFKGLNIKPDEELAFLCAGIVGSGIVFEGLRVLRDRTYSSFLEKRIAQRAEEQERQRQVSSPSGSGDHRGSSTTPMERLENQPPSVNVTGGGDATSLVNALEEGVELAVSHGQRSSLHPDSGVTKSSDVASIGILFYATVIHVVYVLLAYVLMLIVMTFNVKLFVAVVVGIGIGNFVFRRHSLNIPNLRSEQRSSTQSDKTVSSECHSSTSSVPGESAESSGSVTDSKSMLDSGVDGCQPLLTSASVHVPTTSLISKM